MSASPRFTPGQRVRLSRAGLAHFGSLWSGKYVGTVVRYNAGTHRITLKRDNFKSLDRMSAEYFEPVPPGGPEVPSTISPRHFAFPIWHTDLPDSDTLVVLRLDDAEYPIQLGFHDGEAWRGDDAGLIRLPIVGWLHLCEAAAVLDGVLPHPNAQKG